MAFLTPPNVHHIRADVVRCDHSKNFRFYADNDSEVVIKIKVARPRKRLEIDQEMKLRHFSSSFY